MNYTKNELKDLSDEQLLSLLKKSWGIDKDKPISLIGEIAKKEKGLKILNKITNIQNLKGEYIEYPISDLSEKQKLKHNGIKVKLNKSLEYSHNYVNFSFRLSTAEERIQHDNPLHVSLNTSSIKIIKKIPKTDKLYAISIDGDFFVETSIVDYIIQKNKKIIEQELEDLHKKQIEKKVVVKEKIIHLQNKLEAEETKYSETLYKLEQDTKEKTIHLQNQLKDEEDNYKKSLATLKREKTKKENAIKKLKESQQLIIKDIKNKKDISKVLEAEIEKLEKILKDKEDIMGKKLEKLRNYMRGKADTLKKLEFIDEKEYDDLLMINQIKNSDEKFVNFKNDLQSDKQKAISHIQAYLFKQGIVYPRYILEDFLALIQTNDLIVLAGESGSGKTNLVKSFARAIGGKSFIIPVKPNWTSSEDLLGYYNPLEKKYLTTPFLEALLEAKNNPDTPYFICLDEMNLARVEYYFADFLSLLEEREEEPEIKLYSDDESAHILSEFKNVIDTIKYVKEKYQKNNIINFMQLLQDKEINQELTRIFGFSDKDSLIKYHTDLRRMIGGILNTPSSIIFPKNVRIIGAINIDETTHYLSPKILDRAHIMKFDSPLLQNWNEIEEEIDKNLDNIELKIKFDIEDLGVRKPYPSYDRNDKFCQIITKMSKEYFGKLGIEVGLRTIRQGLNYQKIFTEQGSDAELVMNNFILHKILPKMTFDGSKLVKENVTKKNVLLDFIVKLEVIIHKENIGNKGIYVIGELKKIVENAESNDEIVNYWA